LDVLPVDDEVLRQGVDDALLGRQRDAPRRVEDARDVLRADLAPPHRDHAGRVEAARLPRDRDEDCLDLAGGLLAGLAHGLADGRGGLVDVDDHALLQAAAGVAADPDHLDPGLSGLPDRGGHLGRPDVDPDDDLGVSCHPRLPSPSSGDPAPANTITSG
jgi:hypothetical protein